jgi:adenylyltransferase/sulfurtransferase
MVMELSPTACAQKLHEATKPLLLDVREEWEVKLVALPESLHIPMGQLPDRLAEIPKDRDIIVLCHAGVRSRKVAEFLDAHQYPAVYNMTDGIMGWQRDVDPSLPRY